MAGEGADLGVDLDALHQIAVRLDAADARVHVDAGAVQIGRQVALADRIDRDEGMDTGARGLDHVVAKRVHRHVARAAEIDQGGDARADTHEIGIETEASDRVLEYVGMGCR